MASAGPDGQVLIIDTNVLVAGFLSSDPAGPTCGIVDGMIGGELAFLLSAALLGEYRAVLCRPKIQRRVGFNLKAVDQLLYRLAENGRVLGPTPGKMTSPDRGDQHLWSLLEAVDASCLVTGDALLLERCPWPERIMTPRQWLDDNQPLPDE